MELKQASAHFLAAINERNLKFEASSGLVRVYKPAKVRGLALEF
jgi:hypothetical protein